MRAKVNIISVTVKKIIKIINIILKKITKIIKIINFTLKKIIQSIVKCRWIIAFLLFVFLVFNKVHFSSIGVYYEMFPSVSSEVEKKNYKIFGNTRPIRSDEWLIHTPRYFSQKNSDFAKKNARVGFTPKDSLIDYYAPSKDLSLIGKPFNLGYILFGNEYGLSFYFCMLEILLFMTAFEMFFILTGKKILISFVGMMMIGLAPGLQWWLIPHVAIVFVYAMGLFSLAYYFFTTKNKLAKTIYSCLLISAIVGFTFSIYPACQIMCVLIFGFLIIFTLYKDKRKINFNIFSILLLVFILAISGFIILQLIKSSSEAFVKIANTEYPGNRVCVGGTSRFEDLFLNLTNVFLPYFDVNFKNNCELSNFIHFGPLFLFMFSKIRRRLEKDADKDLYVGQCLYRLMILEILFMCAGFPLVISKITLFRYVNRMELCYGFTATIFTIWCFNVIWKKKNIFSKLECLIYPLLYGLISMSLIDDKLKEYVGVKLLVIEIASLSFIILLAFFRFKITFLLIASSFMVIAGFTINPICSGISPITNHAISKHIQEKVKEEKDAVWISLGHSNMGSFLMANGARVVPLNSFYPDDQEWKILNIDQKYYNIYNRYCHRLFNLSEKEQHINLLYPDSIEIFINYETLKRLNVRYILIYNDYFANLHWPKNFNVQKTFSDERISVLKISY